jgi:hypothetical protein
MHAYEKLFHFSNALVKGNEYFAGKIRLYEEVKAFLDVGRSSQTRIVAIYIKAFPGFEILG